MARKLVDTRESRFVLFEMLAIDKLFQYDAFKDFDRETFVATLELAEKLASESFYPANNAGDIEGAVYDSQNKQVKVPASYHDAWRTYVESGFPTLVAPSEYGGMAMPEVIWKACLEYLMAGCIPLCMYSTLPIGAYQLIYRYGTEEQKKLYLAPMISGEWGGTMCLTEPVAGSDVGSLRTKAVAQPDGSYRITGQKIFITAGDHDLCANIIHPVLARMEGDPEGTKGISIFLVPKYLVNQDGSLGARNDMNCSGIEHKMGIRGSATCSLNYGDQGHCVGYLLGEPRQGMAIMFDMMNAARLEVAMQGLATSSAAYHHALDYSRERVQGFDLASRERGAVTINQHPDVKRMLISMKCYCEAMRGLTLLAALSYDLTEVLEGEARRKSQGFLDFLIPICKAGNTDNVWDITAEAIQVFGGYGFCSEYRVEQYARDCKIYSIYEGTNGIQSLDLLMRKLLKNPGLELYKLFKDRIKESLKPFQDIIPEATSQLLISKIQMLDEAISHLHQQLQKGHLHQVLACAVPLQKAFKMLCYGWIHIWSLGHTLPKVKELCGDKKGRDLEAVLTGSEEAAFYHGRMRSARFFINNELAKIDGFLAAVCADQSDVADSLDCEF